MFKKNQITFAFHGILGVWDCLNR